MSEPVTPSPAAAEGPDGATNRARGWQIATAVLAVAGYAASLVTMAADAGCTS